MKVEIRFGFDEIVNLLRGVESEWFDIDMDKENERLISGDFYFTCEKLASILMNGGSIIITDKELKQGYDESESEYRERIGWRKKALPITSKDINLKDIKRAINRLAKVEPKQFKNFIGDDDYGYGRTAVIEMAAFKEVRY